MDKKNPCDHTEDETKGLLHSSESKTSTRAGTEAGTSPTSDEEHRHVVEETKKLDELIVTKQPNAEAQIPKAQSSYSTTISILHTEVSLAAEETAPKEAIILAKETPKTKTEVTEEIQTVAAEVLEAPQDTVEAPAEIVSSVKGEIPFQHGSIEKVDVHVAAALTDDAGATATSSDSTVAPAEETPVKEAPVQEVTVLTQVEAEKNFSEPEPETHVEMIADEKEIIQTEELPLNDTTETVGLNDTGEISLMDSSSTEPDSCVLGQSNESDVTGKSVAQVAVEEPITEPTAEDEEKCSEDTRSEMVGQKQETSEASQTQEHSQEVSSSGMDISNALSPGIENGLVKDSENERNADVIVVDKLPQEEDIVQKPDEEALETESQEQLQSEPSTQTDSTIEVNKPEVTDVMTDLEKSEKVAEQEHEATEPTQNGLDSTCASVASSPIEKTRATEPVSDSVAVENTEAKGEVTVVKLLEEVKGVAKTGPQQTEEEKEKQEDEASIIQENEGKEDTSDTQKEEIIFRSGTVEMKLIPSKETEQSVEEVQEPLDESADLYLGAEDIEMGARNNKPSKPLLELTIPGVETICSLAPAVDILAYSEQEWKGNTTKSTLIRKGYSEMSHSFSGLRRVRGDNYCALRATLYQVLATSTNMPTWVQDEGFLLLPEMIEAQAHLIGGWVFPPECKWASEKEDSVERLKYYLDLLKKKWQAAAACESPEEKQNLCECVFQGGEEEYGLMEALKFLMLAKAVELHHNMVTDQEVPVFCWLLFARDTSENPKTLLANHLSQIGFTGGVEQVEMFLLGYALKHTIQAFRLYMTDTEEFVSHYPDDHKQEWPCVCIVTEDDRHYNVPVRRTVQHQHREDITMT